MTSYGEIASKVTMTHVEAFSPLMNHLLGAIFRDEDLARAVADGNRHAQERR